MPALTRVPAAMLPLAIAAITSVAARRRRLGAEMLK